MLHLATAPKSNAAYAAFGEAMRAARETGSLIAADAQPEDAPTRLMKDLGYGEGYAYDHNAPDALRRRQLLPGRHGTPAISTALTAAARRRTSRSGWPPGPGGGQG